MTQDQASLTAYILGTFPGTGVQVHETTGDSFFFYGPERMFPFATIVTCDHPSDAYSRLDRPGVVRLNVGVRPATFARLVGPPPADPATSGLDYAQADVLRPHPVYAAHRWLSIVNPGPATWAQAQDLLAEAYAMAVEKEAQRLAREAKRP